MSLPKEAASEAAWALLTQGVTSARIEAHKLRIYIQRMISMVESSEKKEHLYQVAGDLIQAAPETLERLTSYLDKTSYALSMMGQDFLGQQIPQEDKNQVIDAVYITKPFGGGLNLKTSQIALKYLTRDIK